MTNDIVVQRTNWHLAENLVAPIAQASAQGASDDELKQLVWEMEQKHPNLDIAIVDEGGRVLIALGDPSKNRKSIDVRSIEQFISMNSPPNEPIYGPPVRAETIDPRVFTVAQFNFREKNAYFYLRLTSIFEERLREGAATKNMLFAGMRSLALGAFCTLGLGLLVIFIMTRRFSKMTTVVNRFAKGDYQSRIENPGNDEIGQHASAFNKMADVIEDNIQLLEQTDAIRRKLFAHVSHELNRPITLIESSLEILQLHEDNLSDQERKNIIGQSIDSCRGLGLLVKDILELSKLEANDAEPTFDNININDLINDVLQKATIAAKLKDIDLLFNSGAEKSFVTADHRLIERLLSNLIENGVRYSNRGTNVEVKTSTSNEEVKIEVIDNGIGIAAEELPNIFTSFFRSDQAISHYSDGTGLGLAIAQRIAEIHGSTLCVVSEVGVGSTFSFSLTEPKKP